MRSAFVGKKFFLRRQSIYTKRMVRPRFNRSVCVFSMEEPNEGISEQMSDR